MDNLLYKQKERRKTLIKKLYKNIIEETPELSGINPTLYIDEDDKNISSKYCYNKNYISINVIGVKARAKEGYSDVYYSDRSKKIAPYISHNKHNSYRFIILHELAHSLQHKEINDELTYISINRKDSETFADDFAIKILETKSQSDTIKKLEKVASDYKCQYNLATRIDIVNEGFYCYYQPSRDYIALSLQHVEKLLGRTANIKDYIFALLHELKHAIDFNRDKKAFCEEINKISIVLYESDKEYHHTRPFEVRADIFAKEELKKEEL